MGANKKLYGWYPTGSEWIPIKVDTNGKVVISGVVSNTTVKARACLGTNMSDIPNGVLVIVKLDTEQYDPGNNFNISNYTFTVPITGYYSVVASVYLYDIIAVGSTLFADIYKNGTTQILRWQTPAWGTNTGHILKLIDIVYLTAGDTLVLRTQSNNTGTDVYNEPTVTFMAIHLLSV